MKVVTVEAFSSGSVRVTPVKVNGAVLGFAQAFLRSSMFVVRTVEPAGVEIVSTIGKSKGISPG